MVKLITGPETGNLDLGKTMAPAFFKSDGGEFKKEIKKRHEGEVRAERDGEGAGVRAWCGKGQEVGQTPEQRLDGYERGNQGGGHFPGAGRGGGGGRPGAPGTRPAARVGR